jgi:hypothetical protein
MIFVSAIQKSRILTSMMHTIAKLATNGQKANVMIQSVSFALIGQLGQNREMMYDNAR